MHESTVIRAARCRGFTLVEVICVIVILAVLSAVALPKFVDLGSDARKATISGFAASVRSADAMVYGYALTKGQTSNVGRVMIYPYGPTNPGVTQQCGHPTQLPSGIMSAMLVDASTSAGSDGTTVRYDMNNMEYSYTLLEAQWKFKAAPNPDQCKVVYEWDNRDCSAGVPVSLVTTGC
jgi:prepilin-type N-terminal cleavage/methylation domain-containing protein